MRVPKNAMVATIVNYSGLNGCIVEVAGRGMGTSPFAKAYILEVSEEGKNSHFEVGEVLLLTPEEMKPNNEATAEFIELIKIEIEKGK